MQIGMMNNPARDPLQEIAWAAENDFQFIDLTLEHPAAGADIVDSAAIRAALDTTGLGVTGHTAWYLPFASAVPRIRAAAIDEVISTFPHFVTAGATLVNVHPDPGWRTVGIDVEQTLAWNVAAFARLAEEAMAQGLRLMVENLPNVHEAVDAMRALLDAHPSIGFHLDLGHAQVRGNRTADYLAAFAERLAHVHLSDNTGRADDHLPLGAGRLDWKRLIRMVKRTGYDGTITLEVFSDDKDYLLASQRKLRVAWDTAPG
jgi:sugar phosphate isomerase/epimerase